MCFKVSEENENEENYIHICLCALHTYSASGGGGLVFSKLYQQWPPRKMHLVSYLAVTIVPHQWSEGY